MFILKKLLLLARLTDSEKNDTTKEEGEIQTNKHA